MRLALLALASLIPSLAAARAEPVPTVIVDIHALGARRVEALKQSPNVEWSAEFGNEMLLGVKPESLQDWLADKRARPGPSALAFDEVVVRDHVCTVHDHEPALAAVGGYEIVRMAPVLAKATRGAAITGEPLPLDGVVSREVRNQPEPKGAAAPESSVLQLIARIDADRWHDTMSELATFNRNSFNPNLGLAHDWVLQQFADASLQTQSHTYTLTTTSCTPAPSPVTARNPIGIKRGETLPDEWIVIGAHYDARNIERCETSASPPQIQPGANDNASGCAGVIELARAFSYVSTARSILFMCFSGEEQGLRGSYSYRNALSTSGDIVRVKHMLNLDMIGHAIDDNLSARVETSSAASQAAVLPMYSAAAATYAPELNLILSSATGEYSDHYPFLAPGIPTAFTWENGAGGIYPQYHTASDVPANMLRARPLAHGILKMDAAVLADVAGLLPLFADGFED
jgi:Peptidase family M28